MDDQESLRLKLTEMVTEHRDLDDAIERLIEAGTMDQIQIQRLKKRKLRLKDQIVRLENLLIPDIIA